MKQLLTPVLAVALGLASSAVFADQMATTDTTMQDQSGQMQDNSGMQGQTDQTAPQDNTMNQGQMNQDQMNQGQMNQANGTMDNTAPAGY